MSRALRYSPPVADHNLIVRPRLLAQLQHRFDRPVTALVAAPGFGKTTLLAQAISENSLSPLGADYWLTCQRDDISLSFLAEGLFAALGVRTPVPDDPESAAASVAAQIWGAAPQHLAIVLDDAHLVAADSPGSTFLRRLIEELPRNGHLVLASRPPLSVALSRLRATGEAVVLDETDMQFRDDEIAEFAAARGVSAGLLEDVGGWPALAELTATVGPHAAEGFVWEELLSQLSPARRDALGLLIAVGGADNEIASAMFGEPTDLDKMLAGLPLVVHADAGWRSLHGLWGWALQHHTDPAHLTAARRTAGQILRRRRQYHDAMSLFLDAAAWDEARDLIVDVCEVCTPLVPPDVLDVWSRRLPAEVRHTPEGLLLSAMVAEPTSPATAEAVLEQALVDAPDVSAVSYACLNALVQLAFWRSDRVRMQTLALQLSELGRQGHPEAPGWVALLDALLAPTPELTRAALDSPSLVAGHVLNPVQDWLHAHVVLRRLGDAPTAETLARRALAHDAPTMRAVSRSALVESLRMQGRLDDAQELLPDVLADLEPAKVLTSPELVAGSVVLLSVLGQHAQAADLLARFRTTVRASPAAWGLIADAVGEAFHLASTGDDDAAALALAGVAKLPMARSPLIVQVAVSALPVLYVLVPETRERWDAATPPGHFAELLELARALVELREQRRLDAVRSLSAAARRALLGSLPAPWTSELAAAMVAVGQADGRALLEQIGAVARTTLRRQLDDRRSPIAAAARTLLRELPAVPAYETRLRTLGSLELLRDDVPVASANLRRERVRQLLAYLLTHGRASRTAITADLWPDLDDTAAARNLRVTLAYLQGVLEPDRTEHDPPYFVRSHGGALQLHVDDAIEVDAVRFERLLDGAGLLERQGVPSAALAEYQQALALWHGDYFVDLPADDWLQWERDRLRARFIASAVRAGNLLLARGDITAACELGEKALEADECCESAYQLLIAARLTSADLVGARRYLRRCQQMLRELGVGVHERTAALARQVAGGG